MAECFRPDYFKTLDEGLPSGGRLKPNGIYFDFDSTLDAFRVFVANREGTDAFPMVIPALDNEPLTIGQGLLGVSYDGSAPITISANFGTGSGQIARGNHNHDGVYRPVSWVPTLQEVASEGNIAETDLFVSTPTGGTFRADATSGWAYMEAGNTLSQINIGASSNSLSIVASSSSGVSIAMARSGFSTWKMGVVANGVVQMDAGNQIRAQQDPVNANDLSRKAYVDSKTTLLASAGANTWFGNSTGSAAAPAHNNLSALTKTDDTNITLTLGGTPATALAKSVSMTLGWTGQLAISRGGTGLSAVGTSGQILRSNGTALEYFTHDFISSTLIGAANGIATLDGSGKVPLAQLPVIGMQYMGEWNASTNSPALSNGTGTNGYWYRVTTAGTVNFGAGPISFIVGDAVIYNGSVWQKDPAGAASTNLALGTITTTTIPVTNSNGSGFTIPSATTLLAGLLSAADKVKLNAALTSETDPTVPAHVKSILSGDITNWNTAYSMRHAAVTLSGLGYITLTGQNLTIAAPTLQQVTSAGNTTTEAIISSSPSGGSVIAQGTTGYATLNGSDNYSSIAVNSVYGEISISTSNINTSISLATPSFTAWMLSITGNGIATLNSGHQLRVQQDPVNANDLARKAYVDALVAAIPGFTPSALTRTNDTNITLTLGGTPATAMLQSVSITAGWSGTLSVSRGGSGAATLTGILVGNGTSAFTGVAGTANQLLRRNAANSAYEFFSPTYLTTNQTITLSGDVTGSGTTAITATIANNAVTDAKLRNSVALSVIGRSANSTGAVADIVAATDSHVLRRSGTTLGFGTIGDASISGLDWGKLTGLPSTFAPSPHTLDSHSNVTITSPSLNQYLGYNGSGWVNMTLPAGAVQNLSWTPSTGALSISGGTGANLDGRYMRILRGAAADINTATSAGQGYWAPGTTDSNSVLPGAYGTYVNFTALTETPGSGDWGIQFLIPSDSNRIRIRRLSAPSTWGVTSDLLTGHTGIATVNGIQQANDNNTGLNADTVSPASVLHVEPVSNGPNSLTAGILQTFGAVERRYQFFTGPQGDNHYYRSRLTAAGGYGSWYQVASRSWVTTTLGSYATTASLSGYVNTTTNQTGIAGWKGWAGNHTWIPESDNNSTNNAIMFGLSAGNGPYILLRNASAQTFVLRSYATSGIQMSMTGGISAAAAAYASGGYAYLVRNNASGAFETRSIGISDVTGLQSAIDGKQASISIAQNTIMGRWSAGSGSFQSVTLGGGLSLSGSGVLSAAGSGGTVTSVNIAPPVGFTAGSAVATSGNITLNYAAGYSLPTTEKQVQWDTSAARWFSNSAPTGNDLNNATQGGVLYWSNTTVNAPASTYGTVFTFVGSSSTGDGAASSTWINQILASTGNDWYIRQSINNWSTWSSTFQVWTGKQFTSTNISQWNTAYSWGAHTGLYVPLARTVTASTGLSGGGALSSNVSLSVVYGTTAGTGAQGNDSRINNGQTAFSWGTHTGLYVPLSRNFSGVNSITGGGTMDNNRSYQLVGDVTTPGNWKYYGTNGSGSRGFYDLPSLSLATLTPGTGINGSGYNGSSPQTWSISFGTSGGQAAQGNDSRINNGQAAWDALGGYVPTSRNFYGANSITGGGTMDTNKFFQLVGDTTTPGVLKYYGTDNTGQRGFYNLPSGGSGFDGSGTAGRIAMFQTGNYVINSVIEQSGGNITVNGGATFTANISCYNNIDGGYNSSFLSAIIGVNGAPNSAAVLELSSSNKGLLLPRISTTDWNNISNKPAGLIAWNSSEGALMWWDGFRTAIIQFNGIKYRGWTGSSWADFH